MNAALALSAFERVNTLPDVLADKIFRMVHRSQMKAVNAEFKTKLHHFAGCQINHYVVKLETNYMMESMGDSDPYAPLTIDIRAALSYYDAVRCGLGDAYRECMSRAVNWTLHDELQFNVDDNLIDYEDYGYPEPEYYEDWGYIEHEADRNYNDNPHSPEFEFDVDAWFHDEGTDDDPVDRYDDMYVNNILDQDMYLSRLFGTEAD